MNYWEIRVNGEEVSSTIHNPNKTLFLYYLNTIDRSACVRYFGTVKCVLPVGMKEYPYESLDK